MAKIDKDIRAEQNQELFRDWSDARQDWDTEARNCLLYTSPSPRD